MYTEITDTFARTRPAPRPVAVGMYLSAAIAAVWLVHGLFNKLLGADPRHLEIVRSVPVLASHAQAMLMLVGAGEVGIALWLLSGWRPRACAMVQTSALLSMNVLELTYARHLLLWPAALVPVNLLFLSAAWLAAELRVIAATGSTTANRKTASNALLHHAETPSVADKCHLLRVLRRHPIPVVAHFEHCLVLTYAAPAEQLKPLLPPGLTLDTYKGYGFLAIALVQTESLRPAGMPKCMGRDFFLAGYRIFARFHANGRTRRGLRILRSSTDRWLMRKAGNLLTHYNYRPCDVDMSGDGDNELAIRVTTPDGSADLEVVADLRKHHTGLPEDSVFETEADARRYAGPLPWTFDHEAATNSIIAIKGVRGNWNPRPVPVRVTRNTFFDTPMLKGVEPVLASAFHVRDIDYRWERGIRYPLAPKEA